MTFEEVSLTEGIIASPNVLPPTKKDSLVDLWIPRLLTLLCWLFLLILTVYALDSMSDILILITEVLIAYFYLLKPVALVETLLNKGLQKTSVKIPPKLHRVIGILTVYALALLTMALFSLQAVPALVEQLQSLLDEAPTQYGRVVDFINHASTTTNPFLKPAAPSLKPPETLEQAPSFFSLKLQDTTSFLQKTCGHTLNNWTLLRECFSTPPSEDLNLLQLSPADSLLKTDLSLLLNEQQSPTRLLNVKNNPFLLSNPFSTLQVERVLLAPEISEQPSTLSNSNITSDDTAPSQQKESPAPGQVMAPPKTKIITTVTTTTPSEGAGENTLSSSMPSISGVLTEHSQKLFNNILGFGSTTLKLLVFFFTGLILTFYLLMDADGLFQGFIGLVPIRYQERARRRCQTFHDRFLKFVDSSFWYSLGIALVMFLLLSLFHIKYAGLLSVFLFTCTFIPVIGLWMGLLPILLHTLLTKPFIDTLIIIFLCFLTTFLRHIMRFKTPSQKHLALHPIAIILLFMASLRLFNFWGILFFFPLSVTISELFSTPSPDLKR